MNYAHNDIKIFEHAIGLISKGWCQHAMATDGKRNIDLYSSKATNFCLVGAIRRSTLDLELISKEDAQMVMNDLLAELPSMQEIHKNDPTRYLLPAFNDQPSMNKQMVVFVLRAAIARCKAGKPL